MISCSSLVTLYVNVKCETTAKINNGGVQNSMWKWEIERMSIEDKPGETSKHIAVRREMEPSMKTTTTKDLFATLWKGCKDSKVVF